MKPLTIRGRLMLLVLATAAPLIAFAVGLVLWHSQTERELQRQQASRTASAAMQTVDRELSGAIAGLQVLAASPALAARDFGAFHAQAMAAVGIAGNSVIILYDRRGNRIISTAFAYGQAVPPRKDMSDVGAPFTTGRSHVTRLFISETVKQPTVGVLVPVFVGGEVIYVLGAGLLTDRLTQLLMTSGLPQEWIATLLDQDGIIIARTKNPAQTIGKKALPQNWTPIQDKNMQAGTFQGQTREGAPALLTFDRSNTSGWTTVVVIPLATLQGPLLASLSLVGAIGGAVLLLASLLAWWAAKHIYWPANQLQVAAKALEHGKAIDMPSTGVEQFDHLARTMREAGQKIQEREATLSTSLEDLRQAHGQLRVEQSKKDQFIATLAHELRNPLAPIRTGVYVLSKSLSGDAAARTLAMMERQLSHMVRLIDDLLDVSRVARGKLVLQKEDVVLQTVISYALDGSDPFLKAGGQKVTVDVPDEPIWVHVDATRLSQVITNVLNNAAKFTPAGGAITLIAATDAQLAEIRVVDTGIGIASDNLSEIFELFSQVKDQDHAGQSGLGIGLSLSRLLVELHGGSIEAHSEGLGRGTTFVVRLPVLQGIATAESVVPLH